MYLSFFHLKHKPFQISTDPRFLWLGEKHQEALATLKYGVVDNKGFLLLTGDVGTGKTTLINALINSLDEETYVAFVRDPALDPLEFFQYTAHAFGMKASKIDNKVSFLIQFEEFLLEAYNNKRKVLLIIDEAQRMNQELLEEVRNLSNIEKEESKLINIFFIGQLEFNNILLLSENRAIRQRVTISYNIETLTEEETREYIKHRLNVASTEKIVTSLTPLEQKTNGEYVRQGYTIPLPDSRKEIFTQEAIQEIYASTLGYPRLINILCDRALLTGYVEGSKTINLKHVRECAKELEIPHGIQEKPTDQEPETELTPKNDIPRKTAFEAKSPQKYIRESVSKTYNLAEVSIRARAGDSRNDKSSRELLQELEALAIKNKASGQYGNHQDDLETSPTNLQKESVHKSKIPYYVMVLLALCFILYYGFSAKTEGNFGFHEIKSYFRSLTQPPEQSSPDISEPPVNTIPPETPSRNSSENGTSVGSDEMNKASSENSTSAVNKSDGTEEVAENKQSALSQTTSSIEIDETVDKVASPVETTEIEEISIDEEKEQIAVKIRQLRELITFQKLTIPFSAETNLPGDESLDEIDNLIDSLLAHPSFKVTVTYSGSSETDSEQKNLARYQANVIKNYLIDKGLDAGRIDLKTRETLPLLPPGSGVNKNTRNSVELFVSR
ncbi:MAG: AAA family ATPase [Desulfocapsaceae bacterium]|nr:AAA family ATPase [Desulfocapsaceae bacterium]